MTAPIIAAERASKHFAKPIGLAGRIARLLGEGEAGQVVRAVDDVDLTIEAGEVVGLVGESGCGKSTLGRMVAGIMPPSTGTIRYQGAAMPSLRGAARKEAELAVQMIFQDSMASLNPRMQVLEIVGEAPVVHGLVPASRKRAYVAELLARVGLDPALMGRYPHQFSGGQRARIGIARALAVQPKVLVCDEAVAALDVSIQAQVLNLFMTLRRELDLTYLFVSHDLGVVEHIADRVAVMYLGRIVELAPAETIFARPNHPYTKALLAEVPRLDARRRRFSALKGELPSPLDPPSGCHFHPRCPEVVPACRVGRPPLLDVGLGQRSACRLNEAPTPAAIAPAARA